MRIRSFTIGILCAAGAWGQAYTISTIAGNGTTGFAGDGGAATSAQLSFPGGVAVDSSGNIYIADSGNNRIRKISNGTITTVAGNGTAGYTGDKAAATAAELNNPTGIAIDSSGNLYIADTNNNVIRQVNTSGTITTFVGDNGAGAGYSGDTGTAPNAQLNAPTAVAIDSAGNLYIADSNNNVVRVVNSGTINTVSATSGTVNHPDGLAVDSAGNLYVADTVDRRVIEVSNGVFSVVAGNESVGYAGDNGPAVNAKFNDPFGVAVDSAGRVYIADTFNSRIRKVGLDGNVSTIAGTGYPSYFGDGGQATSATIYFPHGVAVDASGNVYIADTVNHAIRLLQLQTPAISTSGVFNSASFAAEISPGALGTILGTNFIGASATAQPPLPLSLGGLTVSINGQLAPILHVQPNLVNFQVPWEISPGPATVTINVNGVSSNSISVPVLTAGPGVFILTGGVPAVQNSDYTLNNASNPAHVGSTIIVYLTGSGPVSPLVGDGIASPSNPIAVLTSQYSAVLGTTPAPITFAGLVPGAVGLVQMNIMVPASLGLGTYPMTIQINGENSPQVSVAVTK
ncbi:MAG TPA: hypothetical protein VKR43_02570 [Bryobacteraceae bacterium]|nr:hypothetical protein [Bryobacteraceae bacterium]